MRCGGVNLSILREGGTCTVYRNVNRCTAAEVCYKLRSVADEVGTGVHIQLNRVTGQAHEHAVVVVVVSCATYGQGGVLGHIDGTAAQPSVVRTADELGILDVKHAAVHTGIVAHVQRGAFGQVNLGVGNVQHTTISTITNTQLRVAALNDQAGVGYVHCAVNNKSFVIGLAGAGKNHLSAAILTVAIDIENNTIVHGNLGGCKDATLCLLSLRGLTRNLHISVGIQLHLLEGNGRAFAYVQIKLLVKIVTISSSILSATNISYTAVEGNRTTIDGCNVGHYIINSSILVALGIRTGIQQVGNGILYAISCSRVNLSMLYEGSIVYRNVNRCTVAEVRYKLRSIALKCGAGLNIQVNRVTGQAHEHAVVVVVVSCAAYGHGGVLGNIDGTAAQPSVVRTTDELRATNVKLAVAHTGIVADVQRGAFGQVNLGVGDIKLTTISAITDTQLRVRTLDGHRGIGDAHRAVYNKSLIVRLAGAGKNKVVTHTVSTGYVEGLALINNQLLGAQGAVRDYDVVKTGKRIHGNLGPLTDDELAIGGNCGVTHRCTGQHNITLRSTKAGVCNLRTGTERNVTLRGCYLGVVNLGAFGSDAVSLKNGIIHFISSTDKVTAVSQGKITLNNQLIVTNFYIFGCNLNSFAIIQ